MAGFDEGAKAAQKELLLWKFWFTVMCILVVLEAALVYWIFHG